MLKIRPFEWKDVDEVNEIMNDPDTTRYSPGTFPTPLENTVHLIAERIRHNGAVLIAEEEGRVIGNLYLGVGKDSFSHIGTVGVFVRKESWGRGVGAKLLEEGIKAAKGRELKKLVYEAYAPNERSINLAKQFGFELNGTQKRHLLIDGQYVDKLIFEKFL